MDANTLSIAYIVIITFFLFLFFLKRARIYKNPVAFLLPFSFINLSQNPLFFVRTKDNCYVHQNVDSSFSYIFSSSMSLPWDKFLVSNIGHVKTLICFALQIQN